MLISNYFLFLPQLSNHFLMDCSHQILVFHLSLSIQERETGEIMNIRGAQVQLKVCSI